jgi:predicted CXXCH cytochrome family protein
VSICFRHGARVLWLCFTAASLPAQADGEYVGAGVCAGCHETVYQAWRGSHHDRAMTEAREDTVLGNFDGASVDFGGVRSTFSRAAGGGFRVRTDGPDGSLRDYTISHTLGWYPLQQYLIPFPGGRLQVLGIAWDSRPAEQGGQRWFHLYPERPPKAGESLHWTGREQNWNYQCADCHSTDLRRGYDRESDSYDTRWSEINVACEACHGPGSNHVAWAEGKRGESPGTGLTVLFDERRGVAWPTDPSTGLPRRSISRPSTREIDSCAPCHSRRSVIAARWRPGEAFLDTFLPALLRPGRYHANGQIEDEVYVYGSFLQSRMFRGGVTCSDCHDPHSGRTRAPDDQVCAGCHAPARFAVSSHHHHREDSTGADCRSCHMPQRTYMGVDQRRDHSFQVPRPDLSLRLGIPNACADCHQDSSAERLDQQFRAWFGGDATRRPSFAPALQAGRKGSLKAPALLAALVNDRRHPAIARATAMEELSNFPGPHLASALGSASADPEPLIRVAVASSLAVLPLPNRVESGMALLDDPLLGVRIQAASALASLLSQELPGVVREDLETAVGEYESAHEVNAERPEARGNLAEIYRETGRAVRAEAEYRSAIHLDRRFVPAYVGLADLYRSLRREEKSVQILREGLAVNPDSASLHHSLGLALVRAGERKSAREHLRRAVEAEPEQVRFAYVYAVALHDDGARDEALEVLEAAQRRRPADPAVLQVLVAYLREQGRLADALAYARQLGVLYPDDASVQSLIRSVD